MTGESGDGGLHRDRLASLAEPPRFGPFRGVQPSPVVSRVLETIVRTALPPVCAGCGVGGYWICPLCDVGARRIELAKVCRHCGNPLDSRPCTRCVDWGLALTACRSAYGFHGVVRDTIHKLKYHGEYARSEWGGVELARLLIELRWEPDLIVPVPLHRSRMRSRGYNQSAKLAEVMSRMTTIPWGNVVVRTRATASQVGLDPLQRRENVLGAFHAPHDLSDLSLLLIDDVITTGSTIGACANALIDAGAREVRALTLATGLS